MRHALLALIVLFALVGCASGTVAPGDGPAAEPTEFVEGDGSYETDEPTDEPTLDDEKGAPPQIASFKEKFIYDDGLEVEVTKISQKRLGEYPSTSDDSGREGDPYDLLTVRVKNGTRARVSLSVTTTLTYGPDGEEAPQVYSNATADMDSKVIPGKARTGSFGFIVPAKHRNDVVLEFQPDWDHYSAIFAGSIK